MKTYALNQEMPPLLAELVEAVKHGEEVELTVHAQPVARIIPFEPTLKAEAPMKENRGQREDVLKHFGCLLYLTGGAVLFARTSLSASKP